MQIIHSTSEQPFSGFRSYDASIILGYSAFTMLLLVAMHFASGGSGFSAEEITLVSALP